MTYDVPAPEIIRKMNRGRLVEMLHAIVDTTDGTTDPQAERLALYAARLCTLLEGKISPELDAALTQAELELNGGNDVANPVAERQNGEN